MRLQIVLIALCLGLVSGCAPLEPVRPWEKGTLARPEMSLDADPFAVRLDQHIYVSKEAGAGGFGAGGGGCGCN